MCIIDKNSITWLTKHVRLRPHISEPEDHHFLVAPRILFELDYDSWIMLPLFSVWNSWSCALKDQQGFDARLAIGKCDQFARHTVSYHALMSRNAGSDKNGDFGEISSVNLTILMQITPTEMDLMCW